MPASAAPIKHPDRFFIDGSWATPSSAAKIDVIDSATEELFAWRRRSSPTSIAPSPPRARRSIEARGRA